MGADWIFRVLPPQDLINTLLSGTDCNRHVGFTVGDVLHGCHRNPFPGLLWWAQRQADGASMPHHGPQAAWRGMTQLAVLHGGPQGVFRGLAGL